MHPLSVLLWSLRRRWGLAFFGALCIVAGPPPSVVPCFGYLASTSVLCIVAIFLRASKEQPQTEHATSGPTLYFFSWPLQDTMLRASIVAYFLCKAFRRDSY